MNSSGENKILSLRSFQPCDAIHIQYMAKARINITFSFVVHASHFIGHFTIPIMLYFVSFHFDVSNMYKPSPQVRK